MCVTVTDAPPVSVGLEDVFEPQVPPPVKKWNSREINKEYWGHTFSPQSKPTYVKVQPRGGVLLEARWRSCCIGAVSSACFVTVRARHPISWLPGMCPSSGYSNLLCTGKLHQKKVTTFYDKWMDRLASPTACLCRGRKGQDLLAAYMSSCCHACQ